MAIKRLQAIPGSSRLVLAPSAPPHQATAPSTVYTPPPNVDTISSVFDWDYSQPPTPEAAALYAQYLQEPPDEQTRRSYELRVRNGPNLGLDRSTVPQPADGEINRHNVALPMQLEVFRWRRAIWPYRCSKANYPHWAWYNANVALVDQAIEAQKGGHPTEQELHVDHTAELADSAIEGGHDETQQPEAVSHRLNSNSRNADRDDVPLPEFAIDAIQRQAWQATAFDRGRVRSETQRLIDYLDLERDMRLGWPGLALEDYAANRMNDLGSGEKLVPGLNFEQHAPQLLCVALADQDVPASPRLTTYVAPARSPLKMPPGPPRHQRVSPLAKPITAPADLRPHVLATDRPTGLVLPHKTLASRPAANPPPQRTSTELSETVREFFAVADEGAMFHRSSLVKVANRDFAAHYAEQLPRQTLQMLLSHPDFADNKCETLGFDPSQGDTYTYRGVRHFNTFRPVGFAPAPGDVSPYERFVTHLTKGDLEAAQQLTCNLAFLVQNPGQKLAYIVYLVSKSSVNKELLAKVICTALGRVNVRSLDPQTFAGQFTDWLKTSSTIMLPQVNSASRGYQERMLHLLTSMDLTMNVKGHNSQHVRNIINLVAFGRDLSDMSSFPDPQRLALFDIDAPSLAPHDRRAFEEWLEGEGKRHLLHYLLTVDLQAAGFDPWALPRNGTVNGQLEALSRPAVEDFLREALEAGSEPLEKDLVTINAVTSWLVSNGHSFKQTAVRSALHEIGAMHIGQKRIDGKKPNLWAVRNAETWSRAPESEIARYLQSAE